jgi:thioredoxin 1
MTGKNVVHVGRDNWQSEVLNSPVPVLVDFWAEWCGPCKAIAPTLDQLGAEFAGQLRVVKVNVDENPELAGDMGIRSIPTLLIVKGGVVRQQMIGNMPKATLKSKLEPFLDA